MKDFELSISPVETYKAPELPKKGSDNSALLKKLPSRWQKSAKVLACMGVVGTLALSGSGCRQAEPEARPHWGGGPVAMPNYVVYPTEEEVRPHWGGGTVPIYVVCPTEQEVYGYNYTYTDYWPHWGGAGEAPFYIVYPTEQEILGQFPDAIILINGRRMEFGDYPIHTNGFKMVPALELFEELGMVITLEDIDQYRTRIVAVEEREDEDVEIIIQDCIENPDELPFMLVNGQMVSEDIPIIMHNDQILVPLQFVARTIGADMFWSEDWRELEIFTN